MRKYTSRVREEDCYTNCIRSNQKTTITKKEMEKEPQEITSREGLEKGQEAKFFEVGSSEKGKVQEWFSNSPSGSVETYEQLMQKFAFHFASKRKQKCSATYLFTIRQKEDESLKKFIGRFNNETLEIQDIRIDMMLSILIMG
ncbi:UNVERIFIED_CONTAM: hypothetical protein Scaly_2895400 [Sesamum calycinum]|uniref:Retrotransposon gag domain-containing protein n=1 Tax=Sesamum calycinum TaxID=2727403 RepID=A0AAW2L9Q3_9LAMI